MEAEFVVPALFALAAFERENFLDPPLLRFQRTELILLNSVDSELSQVQMPQA